MLVGEVLLVVGPAPGAEAVCPANQEVSTAAASRSQDADVVLALVLKERKEMES